VTPADYVAQAVARLCLRPESRGRTFHLTNPEPLHAADTYTWLRSLGYEFEELPFAEWRDRLIFSDEFGHNALYPYMAVLEDFHEDSLQLPNYDVALTLEALDGLDVHCPPVADPLLRRYVDFLISVGFLDPYPAAS